MTQHNENSLIPVSEGVTTGNLQIIPNNSSQIISATNNRAQYFAEQAKKYKDDACNYMLTAKEYAESNTDITQSDLEELSDNIINIVNGKESLLTQDINAIEGVIQNIKPQSLSGKNGLYLTTDGSTLSWGNAVEYSEYSQTINSLENSKVNKSGDTMTGDLTISQDGQSIIYLQSTATGADISSTTPPSSNQHMGYIGSLDKNGDVGFYISNGITTAGKVYTNLRTQRIISGSTKNAGIQLSVDASGKALCSFPRCTAVPTATSTASTSLYAVVVANYLSGTSGYRIWSDGYCEQWGQTTARDVTVTFLKTFKDTNYNIVANEIMTSLTAEYELSIIKTSSSKARIYCDYDGSYGGTGACWRACGYLASGQWSG